jgi:hypothetical protein
MLSPTEALLLSSREDMPLIDHGGRRVVEKRVDPQSPHAAKGVPEPPRRNASKARNLSGTQVIIFSLRRVSTNA